MALDYEEIDQREDLKARIGGVLEKQELERQEYFQRKREVRGREERKNVKRRDYLEGFTEFSKKYEGDIEMSPVVMSLLELTNQDLRLEDLSKNQQNMKEALASIEWNEVNISRFIRIVEELESFLEENNFEQGRIDRLDNNVAGAAGEYWVEEAWNRWVNLFVCDVEDQVIMKNVGVLGDLEGEDIRAVIGNGQETILQVKTLVALPIGKFLVLDLNDPRNYEGSVKIGFPDKVQQHLKKRIQYGRVTPGIVGKELLVVVGLGDKERGRQKRHESIARLLRSTFDMGSGVDSEIVGNFFADVAEVMYPELV